MTEQTLAQYIHKRMNDEFHHRMIYACSTKDIDRYIREYNLHDQNKSSHYDYARPPNDYPKIVKIEKKETIKINHLGKSSETLIDKEFQEEQELEANSILMDGEHGLGYYDAPRRVEVYEKDSGAEYVREHENTLQDRLAISKLKGKRSAYQMWDHVGAIGNIDEEE
jgi:hypothetical protein